MEKTARSQDDCWNQVKRDDIKQKSSHAIWGAFSRHARTGCGLSPAATAQRTGRHVASSAARRVRARRARRSATPVIYAQDKRLRSQFYCLAIFWRSIFGSCVVNHFFMCCPSDVSIGEESAFDLTEKFWEFLLAQKIIVRCKKNSQIPDKI